MPKQSMRRLTPSEALDAGSTWITKMKDGRTHLAQAEHAVDLETGAIAGVTVQDADLALFPGPAWALGLRP